MVTTVAGMRKRRCGGIFRRGAVRPDGAVGYRRVPVSLALFHVPYPEPALACSEKRNVFVKPNEQSRACASYAEAGKRRMKFNHFVKPSTIEFTRIAEARNGA